MKTYPEFFSSNSVRISDTLEGRELPLHPSIKQTLLQRKETARYASVRVAASQLLGEQLTWDEHTVEQLKEKSEINPEIRPYVEVLDEALPRFEKHGWKHKLRLLGRYYLPPK